VAGAILLFPHSGSSVIGQQWTQIGPAPLAIDAEQNYQGAGPDSGMITDIAIDPRGSTDQTIYIATENGGIWKTLDGGTSWKPKTDYVPSNSMGAVALDPGDPSIVYAGTGYFIAQGFFKGVGIYKSTDGGDSWTAIGPSFLNARAVIKMVLPAADRLLVATNIGLFLSVDGGQNFGNNSPSFNNGAAVLGGEIGDLRLDTTAANTVRAAVAGGGIFVSTDGGATWPTNLFSNPGAPSANVGFVTFAQSTSPNNLSIYASVADSRGQTNPARPAPFPYLGLYVSTDGGGHWTGKQTGAGSPGNGCQCGYDQTIGVDPANAATVFIGFQEDYASTDSGTTFTNIGHNQIHYDHHALVFSPATHPTGPPTQWYDSNDGGLSVTADGGATFNNSVNGTFPNALATNLFRAMDIGRGSGANNKFSYGGQQDTGTVEIRPPFTNNTWHLGIDGDGGPVAVEPTNPDVTLGTDDSGIVRTTDGGATWTGPTGFPANTSMGVPFFDPNGTNAYMTAATAPAPKAAPNLFQIFFSTNHGASFATMHAFPTYINAMSMAKIDSNTLWAGINDGTVQSTNKALLGAGSTWTSHTVTGAPAGQGVSGVAVDPSNTNIVYVIYPGFSGIDPDLAPTEHIFVTQDGGTTWTDISGVANGGSNNLPDLPLSSVVIDQTTSPHTIIVSSDSAVFQSADLGQTWQVLGLGMPTVDVTSLALDDGAVPPLLRASTFGRSAFELAAATTQLIAVNTDLNFGQLCPSQPATRPVEVFNVGVKDLHISSFTRISGSTDFTIRPNPATPLTISPDAHVDFTIKFAPTIVGPQTATFQINSDDPNTPAFQVVATGSEGNGTENVTGSGIFSTSVCAGTSPTQTLKINNIGTCNLDVSSASLLACSSDFTLVNPGEFPATISPDSGLDVGIQFSPTSQGPQSCNLAISSDDPSNPVVFVPVSGEKGNGKINVTGSGNFGTEVCGGKAPPQTLKVNNTGPCNLIVASAVISCPDFTLVNPAEFPATISPDSELDIGVNFTPTSAGPKSCTLTITSDDPINPVVVIPLTATTPLGSASLTFPAGLTFPPTVIQANAACAVKIGVPVTDGGACPVKVNSVTLTQTSSPADYSLTGLPGLPVTLAPSDQLGSGDLDLVFEPFTVARESTGTVNFTYVNDPITGATAIDQVPFCGEGVHRGVRVLVTQGGVPVPIVKKIQLQIAYGPQQQGSIFTIKHVNHAPLQTVTGTAPCPSFQYHAEWGGVSDPFQLKLGDYRIRVALKVGKKILHKSARFTMDECSFTPNVIVAF
jgi:photosystem II stability/assembly factor-like uncharacterized protein